MIAPMVAALMLAYLGFYTEANRTVEVLKIFPASLMSSSDAKEMDLGLSYGISLKTNVYHRHHHLT